MKGLLQLEKKLKTNNAEMNIAVKKIVQKNGSQLAIQTKKNMKSAYKGHYEGNKFVKPTGALEGSIQDQYSNGGMTVTVGSFAPTREYFGYLEYGTRYMTPRPTLRPAFIKQAQVFTTDLKKLMK